jgi:RHS repeat-associated protein
VISGKERDAESGLDYFLARYYSGAQGRFTSPDIAGPDLTNPQTLNKYRYALNNPLRYTDPNGLYERDVHMSLTWAVGEAAGFSDATSFGIARADQGVDDDSKTSAGLFYSSTNANWHFPNEARLTELAMSTVANLTEISLGQYLHVMQDSFSHHGYGTTVGHLFGGYSPDETWRRPDLANRMAENTYGDLQAARTALGATNPAMPWDQIAPYIDRFNKAKKKDDKDAILAELRKAVGDYRKKNKTGDVTLFCADAIHLEARSKDPASEKPQDRRSAECPCPDTPTLRCFSGTGAAGFRICRPVRGRCREGG